VQSHPGESRGHGEEEGACVHGRGPRSVWALRNVGSATEPADCTWSGCEPEPPPRRCHTAMRRWAPAPSATSKTRPMPQTTQVPPSNRWPARAPPEAGCRRGARCPTTAR
jgi:hypothetical protein